jgi:hypothetical protein
MVRVAAIEPEGLAVVVGASRMLQVYGTSDGKRTLEEAMPEEGKSEHLATEKDGGERI